MTSIDRTDAAAGILFILFALFFGLQSPGLALLDIVPLLVLILLTIRAFWPIDRIAGGLLVPYAAWVSFATLLNASIWWLN